MSVIPPGGSPRTEELADELASALAEKGPDYVPRTEHVDPEGAPIWTNRLIRETSPYLLQHAHNPVDWWPWGDEAFEAAKALDRPIFLSVGYATCHWCHVMEGESFENPQVAAILNAHFIPIKVDREERPDVDAVYMTAVQALTGQGGWPMSVWLDHDREPFYGGTYYPPVDMWGRSGFTTVLDRIHELWSEDRLALTNQAAKVAEVIRTELGNPGADEARRPDQSALHAGAQYFKTHFDPRFGGFGGAPKFPRSEVLRFLLRYHRRTGDTRVLEAITRTLDAMHEGGMYDHVAGGFARYSVDDRWLVPHFEKMLYDNALLTLAYLEGHQHTGHERWATVAREILAYVEKEMTHPDGGFYSATDADSEGEEGRFFVWTPAEIDDVLGHEDGAIVRRWYGVTEAGNFEGRNVLHTFQDEETVASALDISVEALRETVARARPLLWEKRAERIPPLLDDKIITGWNGMMIAAFAAAGRILNAPHYAEVAARAADFAWTHLRVDGTLLRTWRVGQARHAGTLEDHAALAWGCLELFETTGDGRWLERAVSLHEHLEARFADERGGYYSTADDAEALLARPREVHDGAVPSGTSIATMNNLRLAALTGDQRWREAAEKALVASGELLTQHPAIAPLMLCALDWVLDTPWELVRIHPTGAVDDALERAATTPFLPNAVHVRVEADAVDALAGQVPLLEGRGLLEGRATAWLCHEGACQTPTGDPDHVEASLSKVQGL